MWAETVPVELLPGAPAIFVDYVARFERVADFYAHDYRRDDAFAEAAASASARDLPRAELAEVLVDQAARFGGGDRMLANAASLGRPDTVCVVTGQQPSLFCGPLYVLYKAATAVKLARVLAKRSGRPHVPVFWIANDDHRIGEVDHISVLDAEGRIVRIEWAHATHGRTHPLSTFRLDGAAEDAVEQVAQTLRPSSYRDALVELVAGTYRAGVSLTDAFGRFLSHLFAEDGLVVVDPTDARLRRLGMPRLAGELAYPSPTTAAAREATNRLEALGYTPQVRLRDDRLHLFCGSGERFRIRCGPDGLQSEHASAVDAPGDVRGRFLAAPEEFTTNVLLRPMYQDSLLPTVAYVAGPGEVAYYAQLKQVYERFGLPMPVIYPRKSVTLVNAKARRLLAARTLQVRDAFERRRAGFSYAAAGDPRVTEAFERLRSSLDAESRALAGELRELDPALAARAEALAERALASTAALERRADELLAQRDGDRARQLAWLDAYLFPEGEPQERVLGVVQGLVDCGPDLVETIVETIDLSRYDHQVMYAHADRPARAVAGGDRA